MVSQETLRILVPLLLDGLVMTLLVAIVGIGIGFVIGCVTGVALRSKNVFVKGISSVYIWLIRGTPLIVQALYIYFVLPRLLGLDLNSTTAGIIVIAINSGAFISEIVRGALEGVDIGQWEAGRSLGMKDHQILIHFIVPPAFRSALPALGNQFITSVKDTSLLTVIAVSEMTQQAMNYASLSFDYVSTYTVLAVFYLGLISLLIVGQKQIEKSFLLKRKKEETRNGTARNKAFKQIFLRWQKDS